MKLSCTQENLNRALTAVEKIITKSAALPVLSNVLLEVDGGRLKISTTNLEVGINYWIGAKIEQAGGITAPARVLTSFVTKLPNAKINIEDSQNKTLIIKTNEATANIKGLDAKEFPIIPQLKESALCEVKNIDLKNALLSTIIAVAQNEIRPEISGVFLSFDMAKNTLTVVGTDSFRLAEKIISLTPASGEKTGEQESASVILPKNTANELIRILDNADRARVTLSVNQVLFEMDGINLISRLIDGKYPDYKQIIPSAFKTKVLLETKALANSIKMASLFSDARLMNLSLKTNAAESLIEVRAESGEIGSHHSKIKANIEGEDIEAVFKHKDLLEGLAGVSDEKVVLGLNGASSPAVLKPANEKSNYLYVILPLTV
ncbi:DNA polymerase III subunit beta [Patescibacteria group bacterium]|nr:DNA polymerase III subunit beta [Patescibacteria group bacterium]MBU4000443.1 DNA polymerase III subunit beta [Patescibacteria group bacterium]MBU4057198.1 DNA polymerase III subunit beta [Patescibacteria group bacterium]MBU4368220.1 DNA polymerase III subunit beta [Patescibacteria group bacterium]